MQDTNAGQADFWNACPGQIWVERQADLDALHAGVTDLLLAAGAPRRGDRVLDVGCGAGASTFAFADAVGSSGRVQGVDISVPLVVRAQQRARDLGLPSIRFEVADAQDHRLDPAGFDLAVSRFGVMFFADPVAAFRNIGSALRPAGRLVFAAWAGPESNPWFTWPQRIAAARLGDAAPGDPDGPGPMAFRDIDRVCGLLHAAGFSDATGERTQVDLHHPGGLEAVVDLAAHVGPVARMLREKNGGPRDLAAIQPALTLEFAQFRTTDGIRIPACVNIFAAARR